MGRNNWLVSGISTGAGVVVTKAVGAGFSQRKLRLLGMSIQTGSSLAGSTVAVSLNAGGSTYPIYLGAPEGSQSFEGLGICATAFSLVTPTTAVDSFLCAMWGDYR